MKQQIAIFQQDLQVGGIQKSLLNILNMLDYQTFDVDLYLFEKENFYLDKIPSNVNVIYIKKSSKFIKFLPFSLFKKIRSNFLLHKHYDIAIDFNGYQHDTAFGVMKTKANKRIIWIHNDITERYKYDKKYRYLFQIGKSKYNIYNNFVFVSARACESFEEKTGITKYHKWIIPNYIDANTIIEKAKQECDLLVDAHYYNLVTVGRMVHSKGFDILLKYFHEVVKKRSDIRLYIIGDGEEKDNLSNLVNQYHLQDKVFFLGNQRNPYKYMAQMDGFVLTSRYEGQGMVVQEAKALGLSLYISPNLSKCNDNIKYSQNIVDDLVKAKRHKHHYDLLKDYNQNIIDNLNKLLNRGSK